MQTLFEKAKSQFNLEEILRYFTNLNQAQIDQYVALNALYQDWNAKINVVSRKDMDELYLQHVLHSMALAKVIDFKPDTTILDVGTGGGFPAIPLAIMFPKVHFTAVDSIGKKIKVVKAIGESIGLTNLKVFHQRAEDTQGEFDFIISRAVTRTNQFIPWVKNKFKIKSFNDKPNGFLFLKGGDLIEELTEVNRKFELYEISNFFKEEFFTTKKVVYMPF